MKGPISSSVQEVRETVEENDHPGHKRRDENQDDEQRKADEADDE